MKRYCIYKIRILQNVVLLFALAVLLAAPSAFAGQIIDNFDGPDGSPPNPEIWIPDADCDMTDVTIKLDGNRLSEYGVNGVSCTPGGACGLGVYTQESFSGPFDLSVQYLGSEGPGFGYGFVGVFDAAGTPPGEHLTVSEAGFNFGPPGHPWHAVWDYAAEQVNVGILATGDILRLVGFPGDSLLFIQNGSVKFRVVPWQPPMTEFVAGLYSRPGGTLGAWRTTWYDNFKLFYAETLIVPNCQHLYVSSEVSEPFFVSIIDVALNSYVGNLSHPDWSAGGAGRAMAIAPNGYVYAVNRVGSSPYIYEFTHDGQFLRKFEIPGIPRPHIMTFGPNGHLFIEDYNYSSRVCEYDIETSSVICCRYMCPDGSGVGDMAFGPNGHLFIGGWGCDPTGNGPAWIEEWDVSSCPWVRVGKYYGNAAGGRDRWAGIAFIGNDTLLATTTLLPPETSRIEVFSISTKQHIGTLVEFPDYRLGDLEVGPDGLLYAANAVDHEITVYDPYTGDPIDIVCSSCLGIGTISDIAFSPFPCPAEICDAFITPERINVRRGPWQLLRTAPRDFEVRSHERHSFMIHLKPCEPIEVFIGDEAEVYVDTDGSGVFDPDELYPASVAGIDFEGAETEIAIKVFAGDDLIDNDPFVAIHSVSGIDLIYGDGELIDDLQLDTFTPGGPIPPRDRDWQVPMEFSLDQNYPNPFNPVTTISFSIPEPGMVRLDVFNVVGQLVTTLVDEYRPAGIYREHWSATDTGGRPVSSGVYFYRLTTSTETDTKTMILLR